MMRVPLLVPVMPDADALLPYLRRIDTARRYTNFGPLNAALEARVAAEHPTPLVPQCVATVANATLGLELALAVARLPPGSLVAVPAITFVATATAVIRAGHRPLICDVDASSFCLTPGFVESAAGGEPVAAAIPVAAFGRAIEVSGWDEWSSRTGAAVVVDAAGAFSSQSVGDRCDVVYSFHATKVFGTGEGGAYLSRDAARVAALRRLTNFGIDVSDGSLVEVGTNAKLSEYHAAVGLASFDQWTTVRERRRTRHARYRAVLAAAVPGLTFQTRDAESVDALMCVLLPERASSAAVSSLLAAAGIETRRWYCPPLHHHPALRQAPRASALPNAERLQHRLLGLPFFLDIGDDEMDAVASALARAVHACR